MQVVIPSFLCYYSLRVSAILDHFGYPPPHLGQWQQCIWHDLGATQESLHLMRNCLSRGLPTVASLPKAEPPLSSYKPASTPILPSHGGKFVKASKGGSSTPGAATARPSLPTVITSPKMEIKKKKKKQKAVKRTVTSETISPPEGKRKLILGSPDSEAEGPLRDSDCTESVPVHSPLTP